MRQAAAKDQRYALYHARAHHLLSPSVKRFNGRILTPADLGDFFFANSA